MSRKGSSDKSRPVDSGKPRENGYEVGYGRPPKATQFKPGESGNPQGRPRRPKSTNISDLIDEIFLRKIMVRDGDKTRWIPRIVAALEQLLHRALKGDFAAQRWCYKIANARGVLNMIELPEIDFSEVQLTDEEKEVMFRVLPKLRAAQQSALRRTERATRSSDQQPSRSFGGVKKSPK